MHQQKNCSIVFGNKHSSMQLLYRMNTENIVFDKLSMIDGTQIGNISDHLNKVKHPFRGKLCSYFGGYNIVFIGDFDQLPPVTGSAPYKDLLWIENIKDTLTE